LEELGLVPDLDNDPEKKPNEPETIITTLSGGRESRGLPWFDSMVEGSRLGSLRRSQGIRQSEDGKIKVEWEIVEVSEAHDEGQDPDGDVEMDAANRGKRKLQDRDDGDAVI
jgi:hypothetical protein